MSRIDGVDDELEQRSWPTCPGCGARVYDEFARSQGCVEEHQVGCGRGIERLLEVRFGAFENRRMLLNDPSGQDLLVELRQLHVDLVEQLRAKEPVAEEESADGA